MTALGALLALGIFSQCVQYSAIGTLVLIVAGVAAWIFISKTIAAGDRRLAEERETAIRARLATLYGEENVPRLLLGSPWLGCTLPMLVEMLGEPVSIDETVLRSKTKLTYKYRQVRKNQFGLRVFLENDVVTGWEEKDDA